MAALIWLIAAVLLIAAEMLSGDFFLLMVGIGALFGAGAEALTGNTFAALAVFSVVSVGLVTFARPWLKRRLHGEHIRDNVGALSGASAVALTRIDASGGRVQLRGTDWTARLMDPEQVIEAGATVTVVEISGATAVVWADRPALPPQL